MAEPEATAHLQRRSSSQNSSSSRKSQKVKTVRSKPSKRHSASSYTTTTDLTSFPSLSQDSSPEGFRSQLALNEALSRALLADHAGNLATDDGRGRKAALEKLTTSPPPVAGRPALFDDSVSSVDVPGALHLAPDVHIGRLIERAGAIKLVRQFARDLAVRDAEISKLRLRADARERELKRMLREAAVSSKDIERRLYALEHPVGRTDEDLNGDAGQPSTGIDGLMNQAMVDGVGEHMEDGSDPSDLFATIRPQRIDSDARSGTSSTESVQKRRQESIRGMWQDYIIGSSTVSRKTSRASSVMSDVRETEEHADYPRPLSGRRKALDELLFQPPDSGVVGFGGRNSSSVVNSDNASIHSRKSSKSFTSWTVKLFAGNSQASKESGAMNGGRSRASSIGQDKSKNTPSSTTPLSKGGLSAVAALKRINSYKGTQTLPGRPSIASGGTLRGNSQVGRKVTGTNTSPVVNSERNASKSPTSLGPVEMDAILPMETRPPTLTYTYNNYQPGELLTDRFGFIYDQRRRRRQREASILRRNASRTSMAKTISTPQSDPETVDTNDRSYDDEQRRLAGDNQVSHRSPTPLSMEEPEREVPLTKRWQDYLRIATKPTELLSHTPSAGPIVTLTTEDEQKPRSPSIAIHKGGSLSINSSSIPSPSTSNVVADNPEFCASTSKPVAAAITKATVHEQEPVKLLLEQLTELHDSLQRERTAKWNEFLRKVRAERRREGEAAAALAPDRANVSLAMPEASLADGEVVGIAGLGNKGKIGRAKWREFRTLVLGGVPVAHRAKIWAECSGASAMRVPGSYDDLVKGVGADASDPSVVAQIEMDIHRTLTDNVFFRKGPGVAKLKEVLLAYSRRNVGVGYCQGMNLIAASLLLIMSTAEDAFWILASMVENILPQHYYDHGLLGSRADQQVLRQYIAEVLPKLSGHFDDLGIEIEALTFQWFLSVFTDCLSAEALYRVWDVVLCLNVTSTAVSGGPMGAMIASAAGRDGSILTNASIPIDEEAAANSGGGSAFLFQVALALLKLNEQQLLTTCSTSAAVYTYINHQMTDHAISIDGLIQASEGLKNVIRREDVIARRAAALRDMQGAIIDQDENDGERSIEADPNGAKT
ncbi:hypothetical protein Egran_06725 [Elaphomyces granulatus]|uniref:Rab-GAP TBC domain-containing protein n=1 Tax=Elaphomyces granulatus TaxID=519963 RepID=A0A232LNW6_9EURO|nr:hypothetical protein Egran_06725 [Elaphomyces granulatus]